MGLPTVVQEKASIDGVNEMPPRLKPYVLQRVIVVLAKRREEG
jgi:hypothetical protein